MLEVGWKKIMKSHLIKLKWIHFRRVLKQKKPLCYIASHGAAQPHSFSFAPLTRFIGRFENLGGKAVQLNKYETAPNCIQLNQNLTSDCLLIFAEFTCFYQLLHELIIKFVCRSKQNNFMMLMLDLVKNVNSARSTNNPMSSFGLIEYNLELSHIY